MYSPETIMKKLFTIFVLSAGMGACVAPVQAQGFHHHGGYYRSGNGLNWVAPAVIGGVIGYELSRPRYEQPVIIQQPPVYVTPPTTVYIQPPGAFPPPAGYHYAQMIDPRTNQYTIVLVPN
jgi:hypothetical protein